METKSNLFIEVSSDCEAFEWEMMNEDISTMFAEKNPDGYFLCEVENFGWQNLNGHLWASLRNGQDIIRHVLPNTACTFKIFLEEDGKIKIQNFHHDSPTGNEWYTLTVITEKQFNDKERI